MFLIFVPIPNMKLECGALHFDRILVNICEKVISQVVFCFYFFKYWYNFSVFDRFLTHLLIMYSSMRHH